MPTTVLLGNPAPMMQVTKTRIDEQTGIPVQFEVGEPARHLNQSVTRVSMANGFDDEDFVGRSLSTDNDRLLLLISRNLDTEHRKYAVGIQQLEQIWGHHSGSGAPTYVACPDDPEFEACIATHFGCAQGEPTNLITLLGRDDLHAQHVSLSQPAGYTFMGISANATAETNATVTLPGEITTAGGGLIRGSATIAHTAGTNTTTGTRTFTANGTDTLPVTVAKAGMHNASTGTGKCGYEKLLNATATLTVSGDNVTVTWTLTAG